MATLIPSYCNTISPGEKLVFEALNESQNSEGWIVFHSLNIAKHVKNPHGEADFVIIAPKLGVMVLEVKAHRSIRLENGNWYFGLKKEPEYRSPFQQADEARRSLFNYVRDNAPTYKHIPFFYAVIFTHCRFEDKSPEWREWQFINSSNFSKQTFVDEIRKVFYEERKYLAENQHWFSLHSLSPTSEEVNYLSKLFKPQFYVVEKFSDKIAKAESERIRFTDEQYDAISSLEDNPRVLVTGPAGTGKTLLALEAAKRASYQGKNTLFLCFNKNLAQWLTEQTRGIANLKFVRLFQMMTNVADIDFPHNASTEFWKTILPEQALDSILTNGITQFDYMIIDEAQDIICREYMDFLDAVLKNELSNGEWCFFGDFNNQNLYSPDSAHITLQDVLNCHYSVYQLKKNCRNAPRIASYIESICNPNPPYSGYLKIDNDLEPEISYYSSEDNQRKSLERVLESLLFDVDPSEIIILSAKKDDNCITSKLQGIWKDQVALYTDAAKSQVRYMTIHSFKGLESPVIILTDIEDLHGDLLKSLFYVGTSRAKDKLHVLAHRNLQKELNQQNV